jgi:transcriptional regulator with XRE-family HTH domain
MCDRRWRMKLSDIIKNYIEEHNYTIRGFANICGISSSQMSLMARGINSRGDKSLPEAKTLEKLAAGMGIGYRELLSVMDDNALIVVSESGDELAPEKQALIDKILIATPEQLEKIQSIINLVMP